MAVTLWGKQFSRAELEQRCGTMRQFGGLTPVVLDDGKARGLHAVDVRTGSGLTYRVLLDRGMDIGVADYRGMPLCWSSSVGATHPAYYEPHGNGWLESFGGGLQVTAGLTQVGNANVDDGEELGLHGRASNIPATSIVLLEEWQGDEYVMAIRGEVRETAVFGPNLRMIRTISSRLGESTVRIVDEVENQGADRTPYMHLYHCNIGAPIVDDGAELISGARSIAPRDDAARAGLETALRFIAPQRGFREQVYLHDVPADADGYATVALVNRALGDGGMGIRLRYRQRELPNFIEWKMMGERTYVVGMEPANCSVDGRAAARRAGDLRFLEPGERQTLHVEFTVLDGADEIAAVDAGIA